MKIKRQNRGNSKDFIEGQFMCHVCGLHFCIRNLWTWITREHRSFRFTIKSTKHPTNKDMFPTNSSQDTHLVRNKEHFQVNMCHSEKYKKSVVQVLQRRLNIHMDKLKGQRRHAVSQSWYKYYSNSLSWPMLTSKGFCALD